jgi:cardiolipin synthase
MAGALRIGNTMAAAVTNRRVLEPIEGHIALMGGALLLSFSALAVTFPRGVAYPLAVLAVWVAAALVLRGFRLLRARRRRRQRPT